MPKRACAVDGKEKDIKGGMICENDHFICKEHLYSGVILISKREYCPLCKKPLR